MHYILSTIFYAQHTICYMLCTKIYYTSYSAGFGATASPAAALITSEPQTRRLSCLDPRFPLSFLHISNGLGFRIQISHKNPFTMKPNKVWI